MGIGGIVSGIKDIGTNFKLRGLRDILNPIKWWVFINSKLRSIAGHDLDEEAAWAEQLVYRRYQCRPCLDAGKCTHCGCPAKEAMSEKANKCSARQWGPALSFREWEKYKEDNQIEIVVL